jgi:Protein of unknown function (DUF3800)
MKHFKLFIDESGHPNVNHKSRFFVLVGCIIEDGKQQLLKLECDQLKFKYWDRTDIVFHSEEIGKKVGDFKKFAEGEKLAKQFEKQLLQFLSTSSVGVCAAIVDKKRAYDIGWKEDAIIRTASESIVVDFLAHLYGNKGSHGRVVYEASSLGRDIIYLQSFNRYLDPAWQKQNTQFDHIREHLTSITFANKLNHDTEMQIADLCSYGVVCKYLQDKKLKVFEKGSYEQRLITIIDRKTVTPPNGLTDKRKKKYLTNIKGITYLPQARPKKVKK